MFFQFRRRNSLKKLSKITQIPIKIASPEILLEWPINEIKKPETANYYDHKPSTDGLFCEKNIKKKENIKKEK